MPTPSETHGPAGPSPVGRILAAAVVVIVLACAVVALKTLTSEARPQRYGDDKRLDALWDACEAGDPGACDELYERAERDTEYWEFGESCGGRYPDARRWCIELM